jgi:HAD superfamily hydrolase (TIGR01509 family)
VLVDAERAEPPEPPGLVIFDCDGVLVDSEPLALRVLIEGIAERGATVTEAIASERFLGRSLASVIETVQRDFGVALEADALDHMRDRLYALFREELRAIVGVAEAIGKLGIPVCVASSSQMERIGLSFKLTGLAPLFAGHVFSATMVAQGKPAPDLFLLAASRMQVEPARCIVVEDSPAGIEAAKRAGMRVFAFTGGSHARSAAHRSRLEALHPDAVFEDMARLPELVEASGGRRE